jgi:hypothetical protein
MSFLFDCLKTINLYGINFPLRYKKEETYSTITGIIVILSIDAILLALSCKYLSYKEIVSWMN